MLTPAAATTTTTTIIMHMSCVVFTMSLHSKLADPVSCSRALLTLPTILLPLLPTPFLSRLHLLFSASPTPTLCTRKMMFSCCHVCMPVCCRLCRMPIEHHITLVSLCLAVGGDEVIIVFINIIIIMRVCLQHACDRSRVLSSPSESVFVLNLVDMVIE